MELFGLKIHSVIVHEVFDWGPDGTRPTARYSDHSIQLDVDAMQHFINRVVDVAGDQTKCMDMKITRTDEASAIRIAHDLLYGGEGSMEKHSRRFADKLESAQTSSNIPGGVVVVFHGEAGYPPKPIVGVIKAETHTAFRRTETMEIELLSDIFMSPSTKLYKLGLFSRDRPGVDQEFPDGWSAAVYDSLITGSHPHGSKYFYDSFLGLDYLPTSAGLTRQFYVSTSSFIHATHLSSDDKLDLATGLHTYLKIDRAPTIEVSTFADQYLPTELHDVYKQHMESRGIPDQAIAKDITQIKRKLNMRRFRSTARDITFTVSAPPESFEDMISIEHFPSSSDPEGAKWTRITIKDDVREAE